MIKIKVSFCFDQPPESPRPGGLLRLGETPPVPCPEASGTLRGAAGESVMIMERLLTRGTNIYAKKYYMYTYFWLM